MSSLEQVYTVAQIAELIGIKESTVRAYLTREQMPASSGRIGRTPYWVPEDIEPWLRKREKSGR